MYDIVYVYHFWKMNGRMKNGKRKAEAVLDKNIIDKDDVIMFEEEE